MIERALVMFSQRAHDICPSLLDVAIERSAGIIRFDYVEELDDSVFLFEDRLADGTG